MDKLSVAIVSKPQGIKGELKCKLLTDVLAVFNGENKDFYIEQRYFKAEHMRVSQGFLYIKFQEIETRNDAELFRNKKIFIDKEKLSDKLEEEILLDDLIGKVLYDTENSIVGQVVDCENYGASDILTILEQGHSYQVPFLKEIYFSKHIISFVNNIIINSDEL